MMRILTILYLSLANVFTLNYDTCLLTTGASICRSLTGHNIKGNDGIIPDCTKIKGIQDCTSVKGPSGKYYVCINSVLTAIYCDFETILGPWLVFQRRVDGSVNFYRKWNDYAEGFGDVSGEFWLGLRTLNKLTRRNNCKLRIELTDFEEEMKYAEYDYFNISSEASYFALAISGFKGDIGDDLSFSNNLPFSTFDSDHDTHLESCSINYKGAWWYANCHLTCLNGLYLGGSTTQTMSGVVWKSWRGYDYSLKTTEMKIMC